MSKKKPETQYATDTHEKFVTVSEQNTSEIALIKQSLKYMKDGIDEIKQELRDFKRELIDGFVTKEKFQALEQDVKELKSLKEWALRIVLGAVIVALLALVIGRK